MKKYHFLEGFEYTKLSYEEYIQTLDVEGIVKEDLGVCSDGINHVYGLSLGNPNKPTIFINQTHGLQEWRTCYWIRGFAKQLLNPSNPIHKSKMAELKRRFHFYFIPNLNPHGYINNVRYNANGVDLNRNFDAYWEDFESEGGSWGTKGSAPFSEPEARMVRDKVLELKPIMFLDMHTWGANDGATNHLVAPDNQHFYWLGRDVIKSIQLSYPNKPCFWVPPSERPTAANWVARQKSRLGFHPFVAIPESGGGMTEYIQAEMGMTMTYAYCMHILDYVKNNNLRVV